MITVSLVSHGHGPMVNQLVKQLLACQEVDKVILTLNIPELWICQNPRLIVQVNPTPLGFGSNHNRAFRRATSRYFCVINPDILWDRNPFPQLLKSLEIEQTSVVAPRVLDAKGRVQDNMRRDIALSGLVNRLMGLDRGTCSDRQQDGKIYPDWVAGMFMLFRASAFKHVGGFDENYFMYCEDADICRRLKQSGYSIVGCPATVVTHIAQRASHRNWRHLLWHIKSMVRYLGHRSNQKNS